MQIKSLRIKSYKSWAMNDTAGADAIARMKARQPGELMQVDPMSVSFTEGFALKEFKATCPVTGTTIMRTYSSASSRNARRFLDDLIAQLPDALVSVQVDGGSEFRDEFESACQALGIPCSCYRPESPNGMAALSVPMAQRVMSSIHFTRAV